MHFSNPVTLAVATLAGAAAAMPRFTGPYHGERIAVSVPTNATPPHHATGTVTPGKIPLVTRVSRPKNGTTRHIVHGPARVGSDDRCHDLCSLEAHTCNLAVPEDDKFW